MANYKDGLGNYKGGGVTLSDQEDKISAAQTTTSTSYVVTLLTITIANRLGGKALAIVTGSGRNNTQGSKCIYALHDDGTTLGGDNSFLSDPANLYQAFSVCSIVTTDGSAIALYMKADANTADIHGEAVVAEGKLSILEIS